MRNLKQLVILTCLVTTGLSTFISMSAFADAPPEPSMAKQNTAQAPPQMAAPQGAQKPDKAMLQRARLNDEVLRLSQPLTCKADTDCASLAMGAKPCGGPWKFVLYSKRNAKVPALKKKLSEYNKLDADVNAKTQTMSDCSVTLEPEPKCVNKMCVDSANVNAPNAKAGLQNIKPVTH